MNLTVARALASHWRRRPFQLFTIILGLALATALWSGVQAINAEARKSYDQAADVLGGGGLSSLVQSDQSPIPLETFVQLRRAGWQVSPVIDAWLPAEQGRVRLLGVDLFTLPPGSTLEGAVTSIDATELLGTDALLLVNPATAPRLSHMADRLAQSSEVTPGLAIADVETAERLAGQMGYSRLLILPDQPLKQTALADVAPDLMVEKPETAEDISRLTDSFHLNLTAFGFLSFAVGLFIVNGAAGLAFEQRRPMFRTLRALGVTSKGLVCLLALEMLGLAAIAGLIGIVIGYLIAASLLPDVAATLRGLYGATVEGTLTLSPLWWLSGIGIAALGTGVAAADGLFRVARLAPLAPAKPRAWTMVSGRAMRQRLYASAVCLSVALVALAFGRGLVGGFILLGGFLLAAALALPAVLSGLLALAQRRAKTPVARWFWADTRQQLPGLSLALMALLLALSANIGVSTMVGSFRVTFTGWLDQRLVSDLYVSAEDETQAPALARFLADRSDAVLPIWHIDADVLGAPAEIYGVIDHPIYAQNWPLLSSLPDTWARLADGQGALINEQLARREGLVPGATIDLPGGWQDVVLGVYSDYGNPNGQVVIPYAALVDRYPSAEKTDFGVLIGDAQIATLKTALTDEFGLPPSNMVEQTALKEFSLSVFERTFSVTIALNVLTLGVAAIAILTSLLTLGSMRLPQVAPVWAIGVTRRQLGRIELTRSLMLALLTFGLAVPVGLALAWILLSVINVEAFGWQLPMFLFPSDWAWLAILSLAAAGLASLWPARRLATQPPAHLLRTFTHER